MNPCVFYCAVTGASTVTIQQGVDSTRAISPPPVPPTYPPPTRRSPTRIAASPPEGTAAKVSTGAEPGTFKPGATPGMGGKGENVVRLVHAMFEVTIQVLNVCLQEKPKQLCQVQVQTQQRLVLPRELQRKIRPGLNQEH